MENHLFLYFDNFYLSERELPVRRKKGQKPRALSPTSPKIAQRTFFIQTIVSPIASATF
jgi:hypothetical protein